MQADLQGTWPYHKEGGLCRREGIASCIRVDRVPWWRSLPVPAPFVWADLSSSGPPVYADHPARADLKSGTTMQASLWQARWLQRHQVQSAWQNQVNTTLPVMWIPRCKAQDRWQ